MPPLTDPLTPAGSITDVPGIAVGHATNRSAATGCSVILCVDGAIGGVDVRGAAPGTRETELLRPEHTVERVHAVLLTGGSAFGLDAATGVMRFLEPLGVGYPTRHSVVPIVPAAVLYDLGIGRADVRPDATMGLAACESASEDPPDEGSVGAGTGATVAKLSGRERSVKGGIGTASRQVGGHTVGVLVAVNAVGEVYADDGTLLAGVRPTDRTSLASASPLAGENTTIGVVATDLPLSKAGVTRLAQAAHDGLARAVRPAHTAFDGDTFFALSTAPEAARIEQVWPVPIAFTSAVADAVEEAVRRAVRLARGLDGIPGLAADDLPP